MGRTSDAKERLLRVAGELIWKHSYGAVSVDTICNQAGVRKGSFYHFFPSKAALAVAAFEEHWETRRASMDAAFSPMSPPLERIRNYCRMVYELQKEKRDLAGQVLGCPYATAGAELSAKDEQVRLKAGEMFQRTCKYFESAMRDAHSEGSIPAQDFAGAARASHCYVLGALMDARINNDIEGLSGLFPFILLMLRAPAARPLDVRPQARAVSMAPPA